MGRVALLRVALIASVVLALEALCQFKVIDKLTMQPPHQMVVDMWRILSSGQLNAAIAKTFRNAAIACATAIVAGVSAAAILSRLTALRRALDPLFATYYAIPIFAFYPLLIIVLGLGDAPQIIIAFMLGVIAVVVNTLNGLDRVPTVLAKTARVQRLGSIETVWRITLPGALPYMLTGFKLAVAYSLIGIIGAEFIMSRGGIGYEIAFAYDNFDNATMYPLILLVLGAAITVNGLVSVWERRLLERRGRR